MIWTPDGESEIPVRVRRYLPSKAGIDQASSIFTKTIQDAGLSPGTYRKREDVDYKKLVRVHQCLCELIEEQVAGYSVLSLCQTFYLWHEGIMLRNPMRWGPDANAAQALRSLIELGVKYCELSGAEAEEKDCDYMLALALLTVGWDFIWDQFSTELFSQEIVIGEDYSFNPQPIHRPYKAMQDYQQYITDKSRIDEIHREDSLTLPYEDFEPKSILLWLKADGLSDLSECLETEMRYNLVDYFRFMYQICFRATVDEFDFVGLDHKQLMLECRDILGIPERNFSALIEDFTLSAQTLSEVPATEIFSVRRRRRDSRLMRRPIVMIGPPGQSVLMFGPQMLAESTELLRKYLLSGRIPVARWSDNEDVVRAFGRLQAANGAPLRDAVARDCEKIVGRSRVAIEKDSISGVKSDPDLGPIDVFVVDEDHNRFVLVEAKNSASAGGTPQSLSDERRVFLEDFLPTLREKAAWFRSHITELKREFRIPVEKDFTVEEVIVLHRQRFWVLADANRLPIIDSEEFLDKLANGRSLLSNPADNSR